MLGVDANTVNVWLRRRSAGFPRPIARLAGCSIWDIREIITWADATKRPVYRRDYTAPAWEDEGDDR